MNHGRRSQLADTPLEDIHPATVGTLRVEGTHREAGIAVVELRRMRLVGQGNRAILPEEGIRRDRMPGSAGEGANSDLACLLSSVPVWIIQFTRTTQ
jgi:hypothetical protein